MLAVGGPGFLVPGWLVIAVAAVAALSIGAFWFWKLVIIKAKPWINVDGFEEIKFQFEAEPPWSQVEIAAARAGLKRALALSLSVLGSIWAPEAMLAALKGTNFVIQDTDDWFSKALGMMVAEETYADRKLICVGPSLRGVCHGLEHLFMWHLMNKEDPQHSQWEALGLTKAESLYLEQL